LNGSAAVFIASNAALQYYGKLHCLVKKDVGFF